MIAKPLAASQWAYVAESGTRSSQIALARFYHKIGDDEVAQSLLKRASDSGVSEAQGVLARGHASAARHQACRRLGQCVA